MNLYFVLGGLTGGFLSGQWLRHTLKKRHRAELQTLRNALTYDLPCGHHSNMSDKALIDWLRYIATGSAPFTDEHPEAIREAADRIEASCIRAGQGV